MKKYFVVSAGICCLFASIVAYSNTEASLQAAIDALMQGGNANARADSLTGYTFNQNLTAGARGEEVKKLQQFLNSQDFLVASSGDGSPGKETDTFGPNTYAALKRYQSASSITPTGFLDVSTRERINKVLSEQNTNGAAAEPQVGGVIVKTMLSFLEVESDDNDEGKLSLKNFGVQSFLDKVKEQNSDITLADLQKFKLTTEQKQELIDHLVAKGESVDVAKASVDAFNNEFDAMITELKDFATQMGLESGETVGKLSETLANLRTVNDAQISGDGVGDANDIAEDIEVNTDDQIEANANSDESCDSEDPDCIPSPP